MKKLLYHKMKAGLSFVHLTHKITKKYYQISLFSWFPSSEQCLNLLISTYLTQTISKHLMLFLMLLLLSSCKGFLDEDPRSLITPNDYFQVETDAQSAVNAIYSHLSGTSAYAHYYWVVNEVASDHGKANSPDPDLHEFSNFTITPQNKIVAKLWTDIYAAINTANYAIENIPKVPLSEAEQLPLLAEARFFRAWFYFDLVRFFGDVPLITIPAKNADDKSNAPRMSTDSIYQFMLDEFDFAINNLPETTGTGRPNSSTAIAFTAKVYLRIQDYGRAFGFARAVIQSNKFALLGDYTDVFNVSRSNSSEIIFSLNFGNNDLAPFNQITLPRGLKGFAKVLPHSQLFTSFDPLDRRYSTTFIDAYLDANSNVVNIEPHVSKYWDITAEPKAGPTANDLPIIRYADVLLVFAEALNEIRKGSVRESLVAINTIRARARFNGIEEQDILPDLTALGYEDFKEAILAERGRELGWEGHRWFDLVRMGKLEEKVRAAKPNSNVSQTHYLLPIPQRELEKNPHLGPQNPGY